MRNAGRVSLCGCFVVAAVSLGGGVSCSRRGLPGRLDGRHRRGPGGIGRQRARRAGGGGVSGGGSAATGTGGAAGLAAACAGAADPRLVLADQRILRLTVTETLNTVRYLIDDAEATALVSGGDHRRRTTATNRSAAFRRSKTRTSTAANFPQLDDVADHVGELRRSPTSRRSPHVLNADGHVRDRRTSTSWRPKRTGGSSRPTSRRGSGRSTAKLRSPQTVNGYQVTFTIPEATGFAVDALLRSPQMLWRWEIGNHDVAVELTGGHPADRRGAGDAALVLPDRSAARRYAAWRPRARGRCART